MSKDLRKRCQRILQSMIYDLFLNYQNLDACGVTKIVGTLFDSADGWIWPDYIPSITVATRNLAFECCFEHTCKEMI